MSTQTKAAPEAQTKEQGTLDAVLDATQKAMAQPEFVHIKMENDMMRVAAKQEPRDFDKIKGELSKLVDSFPQFAKDAIYNKPCGSEEPGGRQKIARGLSIRAAEAFAEIYGYNRIVSEATPMDEFHVKITAVFTDFQRMRTWHDTGTLSRYYKLSRSKGGGMALHPEDRFHQVVVKAEKSRCIREVVNRSINAALKAWFFAYCDEKAADLLTDDEINKILRAFEREFGVTLKQVEDFIGRPMKMKWTKEDRLELLGVYNALREGETTVADAFGTQQDKKPTVAGPVKGADLTAPAENRQKVVGKKSDESTQEEAVHEGEQEFVVKEDGEIVEQAPTAPEPDEIAHDAAILNTLHEQLPALTTQSSVTNHKFATVALCKTDRGKRHVEQMCDKRTGELKEAAAAKKSGAKDKLFDTHDNTGS